MAKQTDLATTSTAGQSGEDGPVRRALRRIVDGVGSVSGATVGAMVGAAALPLFDVPTALTAIAGAAALGGTAGEFVKGSVETVAHYLDRGLTRREVHRVSAAGLVALQSIGEKLAGGEAPNPAFVEPDGVDGTVGEAILEGVLRAAENAYEQKKTLHLGYLHAEAAFDHELDAWTAHRLLDVAESLTYRQLVFLRGFSGEVQDLRLRDRDYRSEEVGLVTLSATQEILDLWQREIARRSDNTAMLGAEDVVPAKMQLTEFGLRLTRLLRLDEIDDADVIDACSPIAA